jgi:sulfite reductase alpha subunit-like flavoprotein
VLEEHTKSFELLKDRIKVCLFITSSTGNGESPENGLPFFRFLRRELAKAPMQRDGMKIRTLFSHIYYTILGLGSSDYNKF